MKLSTIFPFNKIMNQISIIVPTVNGMQEVGGVPLRDWLNYWKASATIYPSEENTEDQGSDVHESSRKRVRRQRQRPRANAYVSDSSSEYTVVV